MTTPWGRNEMTGNTEAEPLTEREREVLTLMARGLSNGEIANRLEISFETAKWHVSNVIAKLGVRTREEAVAEWKRRNSLGQQVSRRLRAFAPGVLGLKVAAVAGGALVVGVATVAVVASRGGEPASTTRPAAELTVQPGPTPELPEPGDRDYRIVRSFIAGGRTWELTAATPNEGHWLCATLQEEGVLDANQGPAGCGNNADLGELNWSLMFWPTDSERATEARLLWGSISPAVTRVELSLKSGTLVKIDLIGPPGGLTTDRRFFVVELPPGTESFSLKAYAPDASLVASADYPGEGRPDWLQFLERVIFP